MSEVASRELRNRTRALLERVEAGERITVTVDGRAVAELSPATRRTRWMPRERFAGEILSHRADVDLTDELSRLSGGTTDELPL